MHSPVPKGKGPAAPSSWSGKGAGTGASHHSVKSSQSWKWRDSLLVISGSAIGEILNGQLPPKIGKYEITAKLGSGGESDVYRAIDDLGREVAIKMFVSGFSEKPDLAQRFIVELRSVIAALGTHPNLVAHCDVGEDGGNPYVVMQVVEGEPLDRIIRDRRASLTEKLSIIVQVCFALGHGHQRGISHSDLKGANVWVQTGDHVKVLDLGVDHAWRVCSVPHRFTHVNPYMSPESWRSVPGQQHFDKRSDIFSIGVLLYYLLTGKYPFGLPRTEMIFLTLREPHTPLSASLTSYPAALDAILDRALAKKPEDRFATAEEFAGDLGLVISELEKDSLRG